jgi:hypothetical protein
MTYRIDAPLEVVCHKRDGLPMDMAGMCKIWRTAALYAYRWQMNNESLAGQFA